MGEKEKAGGRFRKLEITFKDSQEGIHGAINLRVIASFDHVWISMEDDATLEAVLAFGEWGGPQNRTIRVILENNYGIKQFAEELKGSLEKFEFVE